MATIALEPETIAPLEMVVFDLVQPDFEHVKEIFPWARCVPRLPVPIGTRIKMDSSIWCQKDVPTASRMPENLKLLAVTQVLESF